MSLHDDSCTKVRHHSDMAWLLWLTASLADRVCRRTVCAANSINAARRLWLLGFKCLSFKGFCGFVFCQVSEMLVLLLLVMVVPKPSFTPTLKSILSHPAISCVNNKTGVNLVATVNCGHVALWISDLCGRHSVD